MNDPKCVKCSVAMDKGYALDRGHYDNRRQSDWVSGKPERSFWKGLKTTERLVLKVTTFRCPACGLLESYALDGQS